MKQEMIGWQWHQLDHTQIICTLLQTDNHASSSFMVALCNRADDIYFHPVSSSSSSSFFFFFLA